MSNAKTGLLAAIGAVLGGVVGATAGKYVAQARPRHSYSGGRASSSEVEDAMVIGGAAGATIGAFIAGTVAGDPPPQPNPPRLP